MNYACDLLSIFSTKSFKPKKKRDCRCDPNANKLKRIEIFDVKDVTRDQRRRDESIILHILVTKPNQRPKYVVFVFFFNCRGHNI